MDKNGHTYELKYEHKRWNIYIDDVLVEGGFFTRNAANDALKAHRDERGADLTR